MRIVVESHSEGDAENSYLGTVIAPADLTDEQVLARLVELREEWVEQRDEEEPEPDSDFVDWLLDHGFTKDEDVKLFVLEV